MDAVVFLLSLFLILGAFPTTCWTHEHFTPKSDDVADFHDARFIRDTDHIREDLEEYFNVSQKDFTNMSPKELEFYYFELHDFDDNRKLDGLEMLRAVQHVVEHDDRSKHIDISLYIDSYSAAIDQVYQLDDLDQDGFLSYEEFVFAQQKYANPQ